MIHGTLGPNYVRKTLVGGGARVVVNGGDEDQVSSAVLLRPRGSESFVNCFHDHRAKILVLQQKTFPWDRDGRLESRPDSRDYAEA